MDRDKARRRVHIEVGHTQLDENGRPEIIMETLTEEEVEAPTEAPVLTEKHVENYEKWLKEQRSRTSLN